ncbi:MAG: hypothetical protein GX561_07220 [Lentisphaerae bacterium]|jgi:hypothetical protein|nr:hypothetical protein [Lentisphaerota bacterium]
MATSTFRNKNEVRPKKKGAEKRRRIKVHKARLVKMGMSEEAVEKLQSDQLRALLRRPLETQKMIESAKVVAE